MTVKLIDVPVELSDGSKIVVLLSAVDPEEDVSLNAFKFSEIVSNVKMFSKDVMGMLSELECEQINVEFGLGLTLKSGKLVSVLASGSGTASIKVNLQFKNNVP